MSFNQSKAMKLILVTFGLFITSQSFSQSWQLLADYDTLFFSAQLPSESGNFELSEYVIGTDSSYDSSGIHVQIIKPTWVPCSNCDTGLRGLHFIENQMPWLGNQLLTFPDGHIEGGYDSTAWTLYPFVGIGNAWLYRASTMDSMRHLSSDTSSIYGSLDSVMLFVSNKGDSIRLAKNHGLIAYKIQSEHDFYYHYLGSQQLRNHLFIPPFSEFYQLNENQWFKFYDTYGYHDGYAHGGTKHSQIIHKKIIRSADSIQVYRKIYRQDSKSSSDPHEYTYNHRNYFNDTVVYKKSHYEKSVNPFIKQTIRPSGMIDYRPFAFEVNSSSAQIMFPCYASNSSCGFWFSERYIYSNGEIGANRYFKIPEPNNKVTIDVEMAFINGKIDFYLNRIFEYVGEGKLYGFYSLNDTLPDTLNYFPLHVTSIPEVGIYPNPFTNSIQIESTKVYDSYTLFDLRGVKLGSGVITNQRIDFERLETGIYILELSNSQGNGTTRRIRVMKH